tara:strand:+ start:16092 stop:16214 length:123 start_codon:yes stop_codon:yes gene_type:complete
MAVNAVSDAEKKAEQHSKRKMVMNIKIISVGFLVATIGSI